MKASDLRLMRLVLAIVWLVTGVLSICNRQDSLALLTPVGLAGSMALAALYLAAGLDILLGLLTLFRHGRLLWAIQACLILAYTLIISVWLPQYLLHPFGPILKNLPILLMLWLLYKYEKQAP
ncbi:hypothetical protein LT85_2412 [Collimonas arenae]|uniref:NAD-dependent epimerase/dehydratase n=1 Tax=Collimonas arenae TaxID=279058 RepID=A0A0A1FCQ6_9BURK|nr:DoxX-like family protein [Collimonas arenae]AIY41570.1 hypothetical protein LT85_2412 [Collimonas arenae]